jgi:hypothetical protein
MQQQQIVADPIMVAANDVKISSAAMLHELMLRGGYFLPALKCRFCTLKTLLKIREGEFWGLRQELVVTKICTRPPSIRVLVDKLHGYMQPLNLPPSGITLKGNFPDKPWLLSAVATLSKGQDEIFGKDYMPTGKDLKRDPPQKIMVHNNDGLLTIPDALAAKHYKKGSRSIRMATLTAEQKIQA